MQYRLQLSDLTGSELDAFVASGFAEHAAFEVGADGRWHQTQLEGDGPTGHDGDRG